MTGKHGVPIECPNCHVANDGQYNPDEPEMMPHEDALSLCISCGHLAVFTGTGETLSLRPITEEERAEAMEIPTVRYALAFIERKKKEA